MIRWQNDEHAIVLRADGTGLFRLNDDAYNSEFIFFRGYFGAGGLFWTQGIDQDHLDHNRSPYYYIFSTRTYDWLTYAAEFGTRAGPTAAMLSLGAKKTFDSVTVESKIEGRRYNDGFAQDFAGRIEQQYISYDQYDKHFTNAANVFVVDDDVNVGAVHLNLRWRYTDELRFHTLNEAGRFDYRSHQAIGYYYFRQGMEFCPYADRDDCLNIFVSNKVLMNSLARPPGTLSHSDDPLFKTAPFFGMEARFRM